MNMVSKILTGIIAVLIIAIVAQQLKIRKSEKQTEALYRLMDHEIETAKSGIQKKTDSLEVKLAQKSETISAMEDTLQNSINTAKRNNLRYEKLKKDAMHITNADSLANILTRRYQ